MRRLSKHRIYLAIPSRHWQGDRFLLFLHSNTHAFATIAVILVMYSWYTGTGLFDSRKLGGM